MREEVVQLREFGEEIRSPTFLREERSWAGSKTALGACVARRITIGLRAKIKIVNIAGSVYFDLYLDGSIQSKLIHQKLVMFVFAFLICLTQVRGRLVLQGN